MSSNRVNNTTDQATDQALEEDPLLRPFEWRFVGPYRGGRVMAVAGHPQYPLTYYFGSTGGGVWKTENAGITWNNVTDPYFQRATVGAIAIAPSDPNVIYVGMGDGGLHPYNTHGDGVYKSLDGGKTWIHCGLAATHHIAKIRVHPRNPDVVYVAARGHLYGPNPERGVYRSVDGGATWQLVLYRSDSAGAVDITYEATNPRHLYAAIWQAQRYPWGYTSGGPDSRIYKSEDGGDTWVDLSDNPGLPQGIMGKIGLAASPARQGRIWALIQAEQGGVYRSDNGGKTWAWCNGDENFLVRARFFMHIVADPHDASTVYLPIRRLWKSTDAGRTFIQVNTPYVDQHDLWLSPSTPQHMILGSDGGAAVSLNGGKNWSTLMNQPTAEIYRIGVDMRFPYRVYGSQQDNSTISLPSRSELGPISHIDWYDVGGGESGFIAVRPDNPNIVYSSDLPGLGITRYNRENLQIREIAPWAEADVWDLPREKHRFNWCTPVVLSPNDPNVLYVLSNHVVRTTNEGETWEIISPDLTRNDPDKMQPTGGPITQESPFNYCTLVAISESSVEAGVLWVGSDDGLVHVSRDNGRTWQNVTPPDMPKWAETNVQASQHNRGHAYVSATMHRYDDFRPYLYRTENYGQAWHAIAAGIPDGHFIRVVRDDEISEHVLYVGTEVGIYVTLDLGASWRPLKNNLPAVSVFDIATSGTDIVIGTFGRGIWILDDIAPLQQYDAEVATQHVHLFHPSLAYRLTRHIIRRDSLLEIYQPYAAKNPPSGIVVYYYLRQRSTDSVTIELINAHDEVIQRYYSVRPAPPEPEPLGPFSYKLRGGLRLQRKPMEEDEPGVKWGNITFKDEPMIYWPPTEPGINRFLLPMHHADAERLPGTLPAGITAPLMVPGHYTVRLTCGEIVQEQPLVVMKDPRVNATIDDYEQQFQLLANIREQVTQIHSTVGRIRHLNAQIQVQLARLPQSDANNPQVAAVREQGQQIINHLSAIEGELIQPQLTEDSGEMAATHIPIKLDHKLGALGYQVGRSDDHPTTQMYAQFNELVARADAQFKQLDALLAEQIPAFNQAFGDLNLPAVHLPE
jgi:photosystem II stability/assembly factor-like uncharacterized protein